METTGPAATGIIDEIVNLWVDLDTNHFAAENLNTTQGPRWKETTNRKQQVNPAETAALANAPLFSQGWEVRE